MMVTVTNCERLKCTSLAAFAVYAAYEIPEEGAIHPRVCRYALPMLRVCSAHLAEMLIRDSDLAGSTHQWVVMHLRRGAFL